MNKKILIAVSLVIMAAAGIAIFYNYRVGNKKISSEISNDNGGNFIQSVAQSPAVEGNIVNSGIAGKVVLLGGGPYEYEASLEIFSADNISKPFISVRSHADGAFQVPLRPGKYVLKPADPDGPIAPVRDSYNFIVGDGQWLQVRVEYK